MADAKYVIRTRRRRLIYGKYSDVLGRRIKASGHEIFKGRKQRLAGRLFVDELSGGWRREN
ncbi:hypothetical protein D3C77_498670 [compost metagenome]